MFVIYVTVQIYMCFLALSTEKALGNGQHKNSEHT